jgi:glycolate oxidase
MLDAILLGTLKEIVGPNNLLTSREDLLSYSYDGTALWRHAPEVVVLPHSTEQISLIVKLAQTHKIPVTTRGGGTNVSGGSIPIQGGIVLCTTRMNRIININKETLTAEVEAGVVLQDFNQALTKEGLFYPPDPQSAQGCTLGGTVAENASGPYGVKYGVTRNYILGMEVVLANGDVAKLGGLTIKNRMGYELATLFTGSEGTLGIVTKVTLRLLPLPKSNKTMLAVFTDNETAGEAVSRIIASGIVPAKIEFVDNWTLNRIEELTHLGLPVSAEALLLIQCDGNPQAVEQEAEQIIGVCLESGASEARSTRTDAEADMLWQARKSAYGANYSASPSVLSEDITVPRNRLAAMIKKCREIGTKYGFSIHMVGHAGDGNLHPAIATDVKDTEGFARAQKAVEEMIEAALELNGVISGEHGIGLEKKHFMQAAMDPVALKLMKDLKRLLDPYNILNPGKFWED